MNQTEEKIFSILKLGIPPLLAITLLGGCSSSAAKDNENGDSGAPGSPGAWTERLGALHLAAWPGNGIGVTARITAPDGGIGEGDFTLEDTNGAPWTFFAEPTEVDRGFLLVLFDEPSDAQDGDTLRSRTAAFIRGLGPQIKVALYRRCAAVDQVAGFSDDRDYVAQRLLDEKPICADSGRVGLAEALDTAVREANGVSGLAEPALRFVLFVSGAAPDQLEGAISGAGDVQLYAVAGMEDLSKFEPYPRIRAFGWSTASDLAAALRAVSEKMGLYARELYAIGSCPGADLLSGFFLGLTDAAPILLPPPSRPPEEASMPCDQTRIAANERVYPNRIAFIMTPEQRAVFDINVASNAKSDFALSIQLGDAGPTAARANIRGHSALRCARKSFSVDLDGPYPRYVLPGVATDEFLLISMCFDDRYCEQYTVNQVARQIGLFPLQFGFAELVIDGVSAGVYLVLQKAAEMLLAENARVQTIVRRRFDANGEEPDIHFPDDADVHSSSVDSYNQLVDEASKRHGEALVAEMERRLDLDQYLRLVAYHSLMQNGDNSDETYFFSTESVHEGRLGDWYGVVAWDMDDVYSSCHYGGKFEIDDPNGLLYCAEGQLEKALLSDDVIYGRFVDILDDLITNRVTDEIFGAAIETTAQDLLPFFDRPEICAAMIELIAKNPSAVNPDAAKADIRAKLDSLLESVRARKAVLRQRIDAYRQLRATP